MTAEDDGDAGRTSTGVALRPAAVTGPRFVPKRGTRLSEVSPLGKEAHGDPGGSIPKPGGSGGLCSAGRGRRGCACRDKELLGCFVAENVPDAALPPDEAAGAPGCCPLLTAKPKDAGHKLCLGDRNSFHGCGYRHCASRTLPGTVPRPILPTQSAGLPPLSQGVSFLRPAPSLTVGPACLAQ